jgi:PDZ domain-containing protein
VRRNGRSFRSPSGIALAGLLVVLVAAAVLWLAPSNGYYLFLPDRAHPLAPLVHVPGAKAQPGGGGIYFVDVRFRKARLIERLFPQLHDGSSLVQIGQVRSPCVSAKLQELVDVHEMLRSQRIAAAVALRRLGYKIRSQATGVLVASIICRAPAAAELRPTDEIVGVDGKPTPTLGRLRRMLARHRPGDRVRVRYRRGHAVREVTVQTIADPENRRRAIIGFAPEQGLELRLPVRIKIDTRGVGGPSAGLAFALELMEQLGRDVDHGYKVAATGELGLDGSIGEIGAVKQKTIGAREAGVDVFLVPAGENASDARKYAHHLRIIPVESFPQALHALATLPPRARKSA